VNLIAIRALNKARKVEMRLDFFDHIILSSVGYVSHDQQAAPLLSPTLSSSQGRKIASHQH
jgi:hypothetical protein